MRFIALVFLTLFCKGLFAQNKTTLDYIDKNKEMSLKLSKEYLIPVEIILSIAIIESGSGQSKIVKNLNNHFGIVGPNKVKYKTRYKQYASGQDSYKDFCKLISSKKIYNKLKNNENSNDWIEGLASIGYSEKPLIWKKLLNKTIKTYKLDKIAIQKIN
jgi:Bax protein